MEHLIKRIEQWLESPFGKAFTSDVAIVGGAEAIKLMLRAHRGAAQQKQAGETTAITPAEPSKLPDVLLSLLTPQGDTTGGMQSNVDMQEITSWILALPHAQRVKLNSLKVDELKPLLRLPPDVRTQVMKAITEPTLADGMEQLKKWWERQHLELNDRSKAIIKEWQDWANQVLGRN